MSKTWKTLRKFFLEIIAALEVFKSSGLPEKIPLTVFSRELYKNFQICFFKEKLQVMINTYDKPYSRQNNKQQQQQKQKQKQNQIFL